MCGSGRKDRWELAVLTGQSWLASHSLEVGPIGVYFLLFDFYQIIFKQTVKYTRRIFGRKARTGPRSVAQW